jgi:uncharacterized membrane protein
MNTKFDQLTLDRMSKDPKYWRGSFYFNSHDPRLFVQKIDSSIGWGWTPNCGNIFTYIIIFGIVLIGISANYLL